MEDISILTYRRLIFYNYNMSKILTLDNSICDLPSFEKNIHNLLQSTYTSDKNMKKTDFKVGDYVILNDVSIVKHFPKDLAYIPILGQIVDVDSNYLGPYCVCVEDLITKKETIININYIEKSELSKEYVLKLLIMIDISKRISKGEKIVFLNDKDSKLLGDSFKFIEDFYPREIETLSKIVDKYLSTERKRAAVSRDSSNDLEIFFKRGLRSLFYEEDLDEKIKLAIRTYYQLYDNTTASYDGIKKFLLAHYIIESFKYDFFSKKKTLNTLERLLFTKIMATVYEKLEKNRFLNFEYLKAYVIANSNDIEITPMNNDIIDHAILTSIHNFNNNEKRYYK